MRIAQVVCGEGFSGVERYIIGLSRGLARRGFDLVVVGGDDQAMRDGLAGSGVTHLPGHDTRQAAASLRSSGADVVASHMTQADVVALSTRVLTGAPVVSTLHFAHPRGSSRLLRAVLGQADRAFTGQVAISEFVRHRAAPRARVVLSGVPVRPAGDPAGRDRTVLVAQRLEAEKDTALALRAWKLSMARRQGWRLAVAGRGAQEQDLRTLAESLGVADSTDFLGFRADIDTMLSTAGLLLAPAPAEPLGLTVVEAMAAALPVVAAAGGGHQETVGQVGSDALFAPSDPQAAARVLDRLVDDPQERARYGSALQHHQRVHLDLERQVDEIAGLYTALTRGRRVWRS